MDVNLDHYPERRYEMQERTGRRTVPQIFFNNKHIGGFEDLKKLVSHWIQLHQHILNVHVIKYVIQVYGVVLHLLYSCSCMAVMSPKQLSTVRFPSLLTTPYFHEHVHTCTCIVCDCCRTCRNRFIANYGKFRIGKQDQNNFSSLDRLELVLVS